MSRHEAQRIVDDIRMLHSPCIPVDVISAKMRLSRRTIQQALNGKADPATTTGSAPNLHPIRRTERQS
jgi:hypothetical protein